MIKNIIIGMLSILLWVSSTSNTRIQNTAPLSIIKNQKLDSVDTVTSLSLPLKQTLTVSFEKYSDGIITTVRNASNTLIVPANDIKPKSKTVSSDLGHYLHHGNYSALSGKSWFTLDSSWRYKGQKIHTDSKKQWFGFDTTWKYNYTPIKFSRRELNMFTNILYRESASYSSIEEEIDCYFVALVILRRVQKDGCETPSCMLKSGLFKYTQSMFDKTQPNNDTWLKCQKIMSNVFNCTIPNYIPYIPHGTFAYWNSRLDEAWPWRKRIETHYVNVASTVKDHHYFSDPRAMKADEKAYLYACHQQSQMNIINKNIGNGNYNLLVCDK